MQLPPESCKLIRRSRGACYVFAIGVSSNRHFMTAAQPRPRPLFLFWLSLTYSLTSSLDHSLSHSLPLAHPLSHLPTRSRTATLPLTLSLTPPRTRSRAHSLIHSLTHPRAHSLTNSLARAITLSLSHSPTHSLPLSFFQPVTCSHLLCHSTTHPFPLFNQTVPRGPLRTLAAGAAAMAQPSDLAAPLLPGEGLET